MSEYTNVVSFSKKVSLEVIPSNDPLESLLDECRVEDEKVETSRVALEFSKKDESSLSKKELYRYVESQIALLKEAQKRMSYYVEEIEAYLPQK